ncbi:MAG: histidine--tRNA ligase [Candidatus Magasanikbacteria bacterium]|nr:histidine--tRNA ligase [Candidatus Magasanikbacteria bacterium]
MLKKNEKKVVEKRSSKKPKNFSRLRGMKDVLFEEHKYWDLVEKKARDLAKVYGFNRISTPVMEKLDMYERSTGKETDIVSKEMYSFVDKSGEKVALRPEATPGLVRAYIEHGMFNLPQPVKMFWLGPCFRHDKPQSGRYRQFTQFDMEMYGEEGPVADAQLILIAYNFFSELQINVQMQINSIGCRDCRTSYIKKLIEFYKERGKRSKLCNDCKKRLVKNPLRLLDCKEETCRELREDAPQIVDFLCESCRDHFIKVLEYLDDLEVPYSLNPQLVRGLDYYNRTVFEIVAVDEERAPEERPSEVVGEGMLIENNDEDEKEPASGRRQMSLGGGGRYDGLVEYMGGRPTPACGFGIGIERVIMKVKEKSIPLKVEDQNVIFLAQLGDQAKRKIFALFEEMRRSGYQVRQSFTKNSLKAQLEDANRFGARYCLILGQKELMDETILIRDMESGTQEVVDFKKIHTEVDKRLKL